MVGALVTLDGGLVAEEFVHMFAQLEGYVGVGVDPTVGVELGPAVGVVVGVVVGVAVGVAVVVPVAAEGLDVDVV